jgi:hypothetical protein
MIAVLVDQIAQAPVVVQRAQPAAEPEWKWWFTALAPWVGPLLSCVVSIYVAWKVFNWQGRKDREQWIRDQKLGEWRELISVVASVEDLIPILIDEKLDLDALKQAILRVIPYLRNRLFINKDLQEIGFGEEWGELLKFALSDLSNAKNSLDAARIHSAINNANLEIESAYKKLKEAKIEIRNRYGKLQKKLLETSEKYLGT